MRTSAPPPHGHVKHVTRTVRQTVPASLPMPTTITAQNGAVVTQTTRIAVTGCAKAKAARRSTTRGSARKLGGGR